MWILTPALRRHTKSNMASQTAYSEGGSRNRRLIIILSSAPSLQIRHVKLARNRSGRVPRYTGAQTGMLYIDGGNDDSEGDSEADIERLIDSFGPRSVGGYAIFSLPRYLVLHSSMRSATS